MNDSKRRRELWVALDKVTVDHPVFFAKLFGEQTGTHFIELQPHERIFTRDEVAEVLWQVVHNDNAYNDQLRVNHALNELFATGEK